jgi:ribose transport system ATP-binding protein
VLKDGIDTGSMPTKDINKDNVIKLMIGRELDDLFPIVIIVNNTLFFEVRNLYGSDGL